MAAPAINTWISADINDGTGRYRGRVSLRWTQQDIANNRSYVEVFLQSLSNNAGFYNNYDTSWSVVGPGGLSATGTWRTGNSSWTSVDLYLGGVWVSHGADGTGKATFTGSWAAKDPAGSITNTVAIDLPTIPRASTAVLNKATYLINANSTTDTISVTISRAAATFTHKLTYTLGNATPVVHTGIATSDSLAIPLAWAGQTPDAKTITGTVKVDTLSGTTVVGSRSYTFTLQVNLAPVFTATATKVDNGVPAAWGVAVQGHSKASITISSAVAGGQGATLKTWRITGMSNNWSGNFAAGATTASTTTPAPIQVSGTVSATVTITDSRGATATRTVSLAVVAWTRPTISNTATVTRVNSAGAVLQDGTYVKVIVPSDSYASVSGKNTGTRKVETAPYTTGTPTWTNRGAYPVGATGIVLGTFAAASQWLVRVTLTDGLGSKAEYVMFVATAAFTFNLKAGGKAAAFGKAATEDNVLDVAWKVKAQAGLAVTGATTMGAATVSPAGAIAAPSLSATTVTAPNVYAGGALVWGPRMNGAWIEERLATNRYRWTQVQTVTGVAINYSLGGTFYNATTPRAIPAKPTGATVTSVHATSMGRATWVMMEDLATWKYYLCSVSTRTVNAVVEFVCYGTKP